MYSISAEVDSYMIFVYFKIPEEILNQYGTLDAQNDEEREQFKAWGDEYRENILSQDNEIVRITTYKKRS